MPVVVGSNRIQVHTRVARDAALRACREHRKAVILRPPAVVRAGPAFAFIVPTQFTVETHAPHDGVHAQAKTMDVVGGATEAVFMVVVVLMLARRVILWLVDEAGKVLAILDGDSAE